MVRLIRSLMLLALTLPYAAPTVCAIRTGRSADQMPEGCAWSGPQVASHESRIADSPGEHCRFDQCGATVVAPVALTAADLSVQDAVRFEIPAPRQFVAEALITPPTPRPWRSPHRP